MSNTRKPFGPLMQVAYVVDDLQAAIEHWTTYRGIGPFLVLDKLRFTDAHYLGQPLALKMSAALAYSGDLQVELIQQHDDAPSIFTERRPPAGGIHHLAALTDDLDAGLDWLTACGSRLLQGADIPGGSRVAYVEHRDGSLLELAQLAAPTLGLFELLRQAGQHWDGQQPLMALPS
jgi:methylmalonyl-CoA/ethylmalonyl-CoA epimerase